MDTTGLRPELFATTPDERSVQSLAVLTQRASLAQRMGGYIGTGAVDGGVGGHITPLSITTASIAAGSVDADRLTAGTVTTTQLYAGGIDALKIQAANIAAGAITATAISVTSLSAITANMGTLTAGTIQGATFRTGPGPNSYGIFDSAGIRFYDAGGVQRINADATTGLITAKGVITADPGSSLPVSTLTGQLPGANTIYNSRADAGTADALGTGGTIAAVAGGRSGANAFRVTSTAGGNAGVNMPDTTTPTVRSARVAVGEQWTASFYGKAAATPRTMRASINWWTAAGAFISASNADFAGLETTTDWQRATVTAAAPATAAYATARATFLATAAAEQHYVADVQLEQGELAALSVTAAKIAANTITAAQIAALTITATELAAGSVVASKISVANLAAINADLGTVTAGNINGLTITGGTVRTAASGGRVELTSAGLTVWQDATTISVSLPANITDQPYFAGRLLASGGLEINATASYPASASNKARWRDPTTLSERAAVLTTLNGYNPGSGAQTATSALRVQAQAGSTYKLVVLADTPWAYYRMGGYSCADESGNARASLAQQFSGGGNVWSASPSFALIAGGDAATKHDGAYGRETTSTFNPATSFTVEAWIKIEAGSGDTEYVHMDSGFGVQLNIKRASGNWEANAIIAGANRQVTTTTAITTGVAHHVALVFDRTANTLTLYVDNVQVGQVTAIPAGAYAGSTTVGVGDLNGATATKPIVDEFALYTTALSAARRTDHYQTGTTGVSTSVTVRELVVVDSDGYSDLKPSLSRAVCITKAAQSIPNNTFTQVTLNATAYDRGTAVPWNTGADADLASNRIKVKRAGVWHVTWGAVWPANGTGFRICSIAVNGFNPGAGSSIQQYNGSGFFGVDGGGAMDLLLSVNDVITLTVWQNSGANLNCDGRLSAYWVSD